MVWNKRLAAHDDAPVQKFYVLVIFVSQTLFRRCFRGVDTGQTG